MGGSMTKKNVVVLGSTGSIGTQTIEIIRAFPNHFRLRGISGYSNIDTLVQQANEFLPPVICVPSEDAKHQVLNGVSYSPTVCIGPAGLIELTQIDMDILVVAIVGTVALQPVIAAIPMVSHIAIANKEVLVTAGDIIMGMARDHNCQLIPIDSEHSALFQCLAAVSHPSMIRHITLTASGGPFLDRDIKTFATIKPSDALKHPNWSMGAKISIDSATMMNKGLEVIEAHFLFQLPYDQIDVAVHPKSIVHGLVETIDGAIFAHLGHPDMRYPIQYAMTYPSRVETPWPQPRISALSGLNFYEPDPNRFPLLSLAYDCGKAGGVAPLILNAANEMAVSEFLNGRIQFRDIYAHIINQLHLFSNETVKTIDDIIELDARVKQSGCSGSKSAS